MPQDLFKLELSASELVIYDFAHVFYTYPDLESHRNKLLKLQAKNFHHPKSDPRSHKEWHYFCDLYEVVKNDAFFKIRRFINAQLSHMTEGQNFWPAQLTTRRAFKYYFEYYQSRKIIVKSNKTKDMMYALTQDKKNIQEWFDDHAKDYKNLFEYVPPGLLMSDGVYYAMQGMISILFLSISKSFKIAYDKLDVDMQQEIASRDQLTLMKNKIRENDRVKTFANKIFGDEVII